jgi:hypothetical protein
MHDKYFPIQPRHAAQPHPITQFRYPSPPRKSSTLTTDLSRKHSTPSPIPKDARSGVAREPKRFSADDAEAENMTLPATRALMDIN